MPDSLLFNFPCWNSNVEIFVYTTIVYKFVRIVNQSFQDMPAFQVESENL